MHSAILTIQRLKKKTKHSILHMNNKMQQSSLVIHKSRKKVAFGLFVYFLFSGYVPNADRVHMQTQECIPCWFLSSESNCRRFLWALQNFLKLSSNLNGCLINQNDNQGPGPGYSPIRIFSELFPWKLYHFFSEYIIVQIKVP